MENQVFPVYENQFVIDWLTVVFKGMDAQSVIRTLDLDENIPWDTKEACFRNGYPCRTTYKHVTILWGADEARFYSDPLKARNDMGVCLDISGQGCRELETLGLDWGKFLRKIRDLRCVNVTRLDLAYDDHSGVLDLHRVAQDTQDRCYTSHCRKTKVLWSDNSTLDVQGLTVYVGSEKSDTFLRMYDKAAEREYNQKELHWVRVELQLRNGCATNAAWRLAAVCDVGSLVSGILRNYIVYRENSTDENKSRWPVAEYWAKLLQDMERIRLYTTPGEEYNLSKSERQLIHQYGQLIQVMAKTSSRGIAGILEECKKEHPVLNKKYETLLADMEYNKSMAMLQNEQLAIDWERAVFGDTTV